MPPPTQAQLNDVRARIQHQAATESIDELISIVERGVTDAASAANAFEPDALTLVSDNEGWTPLACLTHLVEWDTIHAQQILYVALSGELPPESTPDLPSDREGLIASHTSTIESLFDHVREADPDLYIDIRWPHHLFGELNWREWFIFLSVHCADHTRQLKAMQSA